MRHELTCVSLALLALSLSACRQDMHDQPRYKPLGETSFFEDKRQSRPLIAGTVARGDLREASDFFTGKAPNGKDDIDYFPIAITKEVVERGGQRFDVFCSPCHGRLGYGKGMIVLRGMKQPPSYHTDRLRKAPVGHFFDVITNGYGAMYNYSAQVPPRDRWAIAAYIRALQYSQNVKVTELPTEMRNKLPRPDQPRPAVLEMPANPLDITAPEQANGPGGAAVPPGAPATPMSPTPPKQGGAKQ